MSINKTTDKLSSHLMQYQMNESENTSTWINHKNKMLSEKKKKKICSMKCKYSMIPHM